MNETQTTPLKPTQSAPDVLQSSLDSSGLASTAKLVLYSPPSYASLWTDVDDPEPGPGAYEMIPSVGVQCESTKETATSASLTAKHGESWERVLLSKHHQCAFLLQHSPGHVYNPRLLKSQRTVGFGKGNRPEMNGNVGGRSPGPVYDVRTKPDANRNTKFSQDCRFRADKKFEGACPGTYETTTQFDGQGGRSFGIHYDYYRKVKVEGDEMQNKGRASMGPGAYTEDFGKNLPTYVFSGVRSFGKAERMPARAYSTRVPGPGTYENVKVMEVSKGSCASSTIWNQPVGKFGPPSTKPRLDFKKLRVHSNTMWGWN
jgi:hypothetical protein